MVSFLIPSFLFTEPVRHLHRLIQEILSPLCNHFIVPLDLVMVLQHLVETGKCTFTIDSGVACFIMRRTNLQAASLQARSSGDPNLER